MRRGRWEEEEGGRRWGLSAWFIFMCRGQRYFSVVFSLLLLLLLPFCSSPNVQLLERNSRLEIKIRIYPALVFFDPSPFFFIYSSVALFFQKSRALICPTLSPTVFQALTASFPTPERTYIPLRIVKKKLKKTCCEIERAQVATFRHVDSAVKGTRSDKLFTNINCVIGCWRLGEWNW